MASFKDLIVGSEARKALPPTNQPTPDFAIGGGTLRGRRLAGRTAQRHLEAYGGKDAIDWVMDCTSLYASTASNADYYFRRGDEVVAPRAALNKYDNASAAPDDLVNLLANPNPFMDYTELMELSVIDLLVAGEFMWLKFRPEIETGKPLALYRLSPALVEIELNENDYPEAYVYQAPGRTGEPVRLKPEHIVHVKQPNPHDPWRGMSIIAGNPRMYDIELALTESVAQYYEQSTRLSGVLESDRSIPPSTWVKIKRQFSQLYSGQDNAYKVAMLERGLKFRPISGNAAEAQFVELTNISKQRIADAFRVPLPLLGEVGSADRQAVRESQRIFDNKTMRPFLNRIQSQVSKHLTQAWGLDFVIDHEYVMPIEDRLDLAASMATLPGVQVKDIRAQVGLEPLAVQKQEWSDIDDVILNLPGTGQQRGGIVDQPIGSEAGRPANPENTAAFPADGSIPEGAAAVNPAQAVQKSLTDKHDELKEAIADGTKEDSAR
jgi:HK97 family phage portal protein